MSYKVAVLLIVYNRIKEPLEVMSVLQKIKPERLYIAADGPSGGDSDEKKKRILDVRIAVENKINWNPVVKTLYQKKNLGCKKGVSTAISWFFENEEMGIILEDDTVPSLDFFPFSEDMLEHYKDEQRVMSISGNNFLLGDFVDTESYYFSKFIHIWGWATWRRAWKKYDREMSRWPELKNTNWLLKKLGSFRQAIYWRNRFELVYRNKIDTWDFQWMYTCWVHDAFTIIPSSNLISNIGFGEYAAHTKVKGHITSNIVTEKMNFPLRHPEKITYNGTIDMLTDKVLFKRNIIYDMLVYLFKRFIA